MPEAQRLVDLHVENICEFDERGRLQIERSDTNTPAARFRLVLAAERHRWFVRADVDEALAARLDELAASEPVTHETPAWPQHQEAYRELLGAIAEDEYCGPAYALPEGLTTDGPATVLTDADRPLLERYMKGWAGSEFEASRPIAVVIEDGAVVSICGNARRRSAAVEAGVETAEPYRNHGYARATTAVWAAAIRRGGMLPLYSTSWDNIASQRVAASLGAVQYATDFKLR